MKIPYLIGISLVIVLIGCKGPEHKVAIPSFYYWKSIWALNDSEKEMLDQLNVNKLYVKFFDVDLTAQGEMQLLAKTRIDWSDFPAGLELCPVIFITNEVFLGTDTSKNNALVEMVWSGMQTIVQEQPYTEIQIDCDWTGKTKEKYFDFLNKIKTRIGQQHLSCTIRLHQIKYRNSTGVPPVDRGVLMIYNLSNPTAFQPINSIFDKREVSKYLKDQAVYPLPLDIALPLFCWGIHFRQKEFRGFLSNLTKRKADQLPFLEPEKFPFYRVVQDTVFQNEYLRAGDQVKIEEVSPSDLESGLADGQGIIKNDSFRVIFYHLEEQLLNNYEYEILQDLIESTR